MPNNFFYFFICLELCLYRLQMVQYFYRWYWFLLCEFENQLVAGPSHLVDRGTCTWNHQTLLQTICIHFQVIVDGTMFHRYRVKRRLERFDLYSVFDQKHGDLQIATNYALLNYSPSYPVNFSSIYPRNPAKPPSIRLSVPVKWT